PILLAKAVLPAMTKRGFGRIVNVTSGSVRAPIPGLDVSSGARAGLTAFLAGVAREVARFGVTINHLQPGAFDTDRIRGAVARQAAASGADPGAIHAARRASIPAGRYGRAEEFGEICAFLCSMQAGYVTGQSLLVDGGAFPGAF
ncbi:MAG: SDR family oxidoreductase, partial [Hyphomicrobiales bacterium]|nr:SDR family oxidoreductase [Hyphomicrobiales bacterium]